MLFYRSWYYSFIKLRRRIVVVTAPRVVLIIRLVVGILSWNGLDLIGSTKIVFVLLFLEPTALTFSFAGSAAL